MNITQEVTTQMRSMWNHKRKLEENGNAIGELDVHAKVCCRDVRVSDILSQSNMLYAIYKQIQLSTATRKKCINRTRNNSSGVLCMEADIQYMTTQNFLLTSVTSR